jgi:protein-S-isoprenylcysteine O-methyltransferase Ste14
VGLYLAWITRFQILPEERMLAERFPDAYPAYRRRVRRWL